MILTGGLGTENLTTLGIISLYRQLGARILLAAPMAGQPSGCLRLPAWKLKPFTAFEYQPAKEDIPSMRIIL